jgi:hypothetical protein
VPVFHRGEQVGSYRRYDERLTVALLSMATARGNVPVLGRHAPDAERHAVRFEALVAEVAAGLGEPDPRDDPGPAESGETARIWSGGVSPFADEDFMAEMAAFCEDPEG